MDAITAIKPNAYPTLAVILVPGFVAAAPWVGCVFWPELQQVSTWANATLPVSLTLLGVTLVLGFVLEDVGSTIELLWADRRMKKKLNIPNSNWERYLGLTTGTEIIGQRYLQTIRLRYKFELSMLPASVFSMGGVILGQVLDHGLGWGRTVGLSVMLLALIAYLFRETVCSAQVLERTRQIVIDACNNQGGIAVSPPAGP
jgi:uncharacterized membrane protein YidH (DUF202 family)